MSTGGISGAISGAIMGFMIGGPWGALIGAGAGYFLGDEFLNAPDMPSLGEPDIAELSINQAKEGGVVVDFLGTTKISSANYLWYGKERVEEVTQEVESGGKGGGGSSEDVVTGHQHFLSWALGIATGQVDNLYAIFKGDDVVWAGNLACPASGGEETIDLGVVSIDLRFHRTVMDPGEIISMGPATFYFGTTDQVANASMTAELGSKLSPPYRRLSYCFMDDCFIGGYNRAPTMKFILGKYPVFAFNSKNTINTYDHNPAHAIWYILTEMAGMSDSLLDSTAFSDVADTLHTEGLGVSINFNRQQDAGIYVESILRHIDGILRYENDGKFHLKLNRDDIAVGSLPVVTEDDMLDDLQINRKSWLDTLNDIKVQYIKRTGEAFLSDEGSAFIEEGSVGITYPKRCVVRTSDGVLHAAFLSKNTPQFYGLYYRSTDSGKTWAYIATLGATGVVVADYGVYVGPDDTLYFTWGYNNRVAVRTYDYGATQTLGSWQYIDAGYLYRFNIIVIFNEAGSPYVLFRAQSGATNHVIVHPGIDPAKTGVKATTVAGLQRFDACFDSGGIIHIIATASYLGSPKKRITHSSGWTTGDATPPPHWEWHALYEGATIHADVTKYHDWPQIVMDNNNYMHVFWGQNVTGQTVWYVPAYSNYKGISWSPTKILRPETNECGSYIHVSASITTNGDLHCVYCNYAVSWIRYVGSQDGGNTFSDEITIASSGIYIDAPYLMWQRYPTFVQAYSGISFVHRKNTSGNLSVMYNGGSLWDSDSFFDFEEAEINVRDMANQKLVGKINHKTVKMGMFAVPASVAWIADRLLKNEAYPLAAYSFPANRNIFRWDPGDAFVLNYTPYSISGKACRVVALTEDDAESEVITVNAIEDIHYLAAETSFVPVEGDPDIRDTSVDALVTMDIFDAPYVLAGEVKKAVSVAGRETGNELGYQLFMSIDDGVSYSRIGVIVHYTPYGTLDAEYPASTYQIDDETGFQITFSAESQIASVETTTREHLLNGKYMALLGDELISFQTITPVSGTTYKLENIFRGRFDTEKATHAAASPFWLLGLSFFGILQNANLLVGESRKFKMVPYNAKSSGSLSSAVVTSHTVTGRSLTPYRPDNLAADDKGIRPTYTAGDDIVLTWRARIRGAEWANFESTAPPTWEGKFKIETWVSAVLVRTTTDIDAVTWTYTNAMNVADNGAAANTIEFRVFNFIDETGRRYESVYDSVVVNKE